MDFLDGHGPFDPHRSNLRSTRTGSRCRRRGVGSLVSNSPKKVSHVKTDLAVFRRQKASECPQRTALLGLLFLCGRSPVPSQCDPIRRPYDLLWTISIRAVHLRTDVDLGRVGSLSGSPTDGTRKDPGSKATLKGEDRLVNPDRKGKGTCTWCRRDAHGREDGRQRARERREPRQTGRRGTETDTCEVQVRTVCATKQMASARDAPGRRGTPVPSPGRVAPSPFRTPGISLSRRSRATRRRHGSFNASNAPSTSHPSTTRRCAPSTRIGSHASELLLRRTFLVRWRGTKLLGHRRTIHLPMHHGPQRRAIPNRNPYGPWTAWTVCGR